MTHKYQTPACVIYIVIAIISTGMLTIPVEAMDGSFGGGDGSQANPFIIEDIWDLQNISSNLSAYYILMDDINASLTASWNSGAGFNPIGGSTSRFTGSFNGRNHTIRGLSIDRPNSDYVGLFGHIGDSGRVRDVGLVDFNVTGHSYVGGLAGMNRGFLTSPHISGNVSGTGENVGGLSGFNVYTGRVDNSYCVGNVSGTGNYLGGLVGKNTGTVDHSYFIGEVTGTANNVGGIAGYNTMRVNDSYVRGTVSGKEVVGGLVGFSDYRINGSYSLANVDGTNKVGGLVGENQGSVSRSYSTGNVTGTDYVGGLAGYHNRGTMLDSHATGAVSGRAGIGGLSGYSDGQVTRSYATGNATASSNGAGGLVGTNNGQIVDSYSEGHVTGSLDIGGLMGLIGLGTVSNSHYNVDDVLIKGGHHLTIGGLFDAQYQDWLSGNLSLNIADYSTSLVPSGGSFEISSIQGLQDLLGFADGEGVKFRLAGDIDLSTAPGLYIPFFAAEFDGLNHTISHLDIDLPWVRDIGMFGDNVYGAIKNLRLLEMEVSGYDMVGGLVGANHGGDVSNVFADGNVTGGQSVGGLIGWSNGGTVSSTRVAVNVSGDEDVGGLLGSNGGMVSTSLATGRVAGERYIGGIAGYGYGPISNSYATGTVDGTFGIGGLIGYMINEKVFNSYATGLVTGTSYVGGLVGIKGGGDVDFCFWDSETSGQTSSAGGTGRSTAEMKTRSTFTNVGWDFVRVWSIVDNVTYPFFSWQDAEPPMAEAGVDQYVAQGTSATLNGSGSSDDFGITGYTWTFTDGGPATLHGITPTYRFDNLGSFLITLNVTDILGHWGVDTMTVTVDDRTAPVVEAGPAQTVDQRDLVTFDGSGSSDINGVANLTWTFLDGVPVVLNGIRPTYQFNSSGVFVVVLNVTDTAGNWGIDTMTVTVNDITPPVADAGPAQTVDEGTQVTFDGGDSSDNVGIIAYFWTFMDRDPVTLFGANPTYLFNHPGVFEVVLNVTDATGRWDIDTVIIIVNDTTTPTADAGEDQTVDEGTQVTFDGSGCHDNAGIVDHAWTFVDGISITLHGVRPTFRFDNPGVFLVTLCVSDSAGNQASDTLVVTVHDVTAPVADAGPDRSIDTGTSMTFDGFGSTDNIGIVNFTWRFAYRVDEVLMYGASPTFTFNVRGAYQIVLRVTDAAGLAHEDTMTLTVKDIRPPIADAGPDQMVPVGSLVVLDGSFSTDDMGMDRLVWAFTYRGEANTLEGEVVRFTFDDGGVYEVVLTVTDMDGNENNDTVIITAVSTGTVTGTVVDEDSNPVSGALVTLTKPDGRTQSATTAANGSFAIEVLHGNFIWRISKDGYKAIDGSSSVSAMHKTELDLMDHPLVREDEGGSSAPSSIMISVVVILLVSSVVLILLMRRRAQEPT